MSNRLQNYQIATASTPVRARLEIAEADYIRRRRQHLDNANPDTALALAFAAFRVNRWPEGWARYEYRFRDRPERDMPAITCADTGAQIPHWDCGPAPRRLLVVAEQGLGDTLFFSRYLKVLLDAGIETVLAEWPAQWPILRTLDARLRFTPRNEAVTLECGDAFVRLGSLPLRLSLFHPEEVAAYLKPPRRGARAERINNRRRIGLVWHGNTKHRADAQRSTRLKYFKPWLSNPELKIFSLQFPGGSIQDPDHLLRMCASPPRRTFGAYGDFSGIATFMKGLDEVVCVDTALAHLAGALGVPTRLLLHAPDPDWRWPLDDAAPGWYQSMMRFTQDSPGDWSSAIAKITP